MGKFYTPRNRLRLFEQAADERRVREHVTPYPEAVRDLKSIMPLQYLPKYAPRIVLFHGPQDYTRTKDGVSTLTISNTAYLNLDVLPWPLQRYVVRFFCWLDRRQGLQRG